MQDQVNAIPAHLKRVPWNKGKVTGAKPPLHPKHVWSIGRNFRLKAGSGPCHVQLGDRQQAS